MFILNRYYQLGYQSVKTGIGAKSQGAKRVIDDLFVAQNLLQAVLKTHIVYLFAGEVLLVAIHDMSVLYPYT